MTRRETFISELINQFNSDAAFPAKVERSLTRGFSAEEGVVLVVHRGGEIVESRVAGSVSRRAEIRFSVLSRGEEPEVDADAVLEYAHPLIKAFTYPQLLTVLELKTDEPRYADGNGGICMITAHYLFHYFTAADSLTG